MNNISCGASHFNFRSNVTSLILMKNFETHLKELGFALVVGRTFSLDALSSGLQLHLGLMTWNGLMIHILIVVGWEFFHVWVTIDSTLWCNLCLLSYLQGVICAPLHIWNCYEEYWQSFSYLLDSSLITWTSLIGWQNMWLKYQLYIHSVGN